MSDPKNIPLILTTHHRAQIEAEGVAAFPNECCGIMFGRDVDGRRVIEELQPVGNASEEGERYHRFSISGHQLMQAERNCINEKMVLGFYHSHPDHPAQPSEYDREHAWPFYSYVIVAIHSKKPVDMTCWVLDAQTEQFVKQPICLA